MAEIGRMDNTILAYYRTRSICVGLSHGIYNILFNFSGELRSLQLGVVHLYQHTGLYAAHHPMVQHDARDYGQVRAGDRH